MLNQQIVDYLNQNRELFSKESLFLKLHKAGYPEVAINEAIGVVYGQKKEEQGAKTSFWDFWHKKVYQNGKEKLIDFVAGFVFYLVLVAFGYFIVIGFVYVPGILFSIYLLFKRKYISLGFFTGIILGIFFGLSRLLNYF